MIEIDGKELSWQQFSTMPCTCAGECGSSSSPITQFIDVQCWLFGTQPSNARGWAQAAPNELTEHIKFHQGTQDGGV